MEYIVIAKHDPLWVQATEFYGEAGKQKAQRMINEGYFNRHLYPEDKGTEFIVVAKEAKPCKQKSILTKRSA